MKNNKKSNVPSALSCAVTRLACAGSEIAQIVRTGRSTLVVTTRMAACVQETAQRGSNKDSLNTHPQQAKCRYRQRTDVSTLTYSYNFSPSSDNYSTTFKFPHRTPRGPFITVG